MAGWRPKAVARLRKSGSALDLLRDSVPQGTLAKNTLVTNGYPASVIYGIARRLILIIRFHSLRRVPKRLWGLPGKVATVRE